MTVKTTVILFDLWMTLVYSLFIDPVFSLQQFLDYKNGENAELDPEFLTTCLTTDLNVESEFLAAVAKMHGVEVTPHVIPKFTALLKSERGNFNKYPETDEVLAALSAQKKRLGLVSNLWPFPVPHIFEVNGLGAYFEHLGFSFQLGARKPDPSIFLRVCEKLGVKPEECTMVGDSMTNDVRGALAVGMKAILINRTGTPAPDLPDGVREITSLRELL